MSFYLNVIIWSINFFLKRVSCVGEGILSLRWSPTERHRCTAERLHRPHTMRGRIAARHLLSCGVILKLQEKGKPSLQSVCESEQWQLTTLLRSQVHGTLQRVGGWWSLSHPHILFLRPEAASLNFSNTVLMSLLLTHPVLTAYQIRLSLKDTICLSTHQTCCFKW